MTRRDFELIAATLNSSQEGVSLFTNADSVARERRTIKRVARVFSDRLRATNPRFDRARFMAACGFKGE